MLASASLISFVIRDYSDGAIILLILLINTLLGFLQEYKSEKIAEKLAQLVSKHVYLRREGENLLVDQTQIVVGDIIIVRQGDVVPVDLRLIQNDNLQVDESQLSGESLLLNKNYNSSDPTNSLVFAGSVIAKGEGIGVVYATINSTELGAIAKLSNQTKKITQYEKSLQEFSAALVKIVLLALAMIFIFKLILNYHHLNISQSFLFIVALAVAVVPEVLPVITTLTLSRAAMLLAKKHVVVKRLSAIEDLANVNLLCSDKTGTLTENKMTVVDVIAAKLDLTQILLAATISSLKTEEKTNYNSYDQAFSAYLSDIIKEQGSLYKIIKELPFDPDVKRKRIIVCHHLSREYYLIILGAPEVLLDLADCSTKESYLKDISLRGQKGLHILALAYKKIIYNANFDILNNEYELEFMGYISLLDKIRSTVKDTIIQAQKLGIELKILTGDSLEVARYVAQEIGLIQSEADKIYLGSDLDSMSPQEFKHAVINAKVFARVSPTQKYNIIKSVKETNVVAYQGDGINDAPALKIADVAIAVESATDIAKENADIILLEKSLAVIINGVKYGRMAFININKYIKYTMLSNFGNFIALAIMYLFSNTLPLMPVQLLLVAIITDLPLTTISFDNVGLAEIDSPANYEHKEMMLFSLILGIPTALFIIFYWALISSYQMINYSTNLYLFFSFIALIVFYSVRTKKSFIHSEIIPPIINIAFALGLVATLAIVYIPQIAHWFNFIPPSLNALLIIAVIGIIYFFIIDLAKVYFYQHFYPAKHFKTK